MYNSVEKVFARTSHIICVNLHRSRVIEGFSSNNVTLANHQKTTRFIVAAHLCNLLDALNRSFFFATVKHHSHFLKKDCKGFGFGLRFFPEIYFYPCHF